MNKESNLDLGCINNGIRWYLLMFYVIRRKCRKLQDFVSLSLNCVRETICESGEEDGTFAQLCLRMRSVTSK